MQACQACGGYDINCPHCDGSGEVREHQKWTTEPPTKPGWYWARPGPKWTDRETQAVQVMSIGSTRLVSAPGCDGFTDLDYYDLWAGPIEAPPLPEGER